MRVHYAAWSSMLVKGACWPYTPTSPHPASPNFTLPTPTLSTTHPPARCSCGSQGDFSSPVLRMHYCSLRTPDQVGGAGRALCTEGRWRSFKGGVRQLAPGAAACRGLPYAGQSGHAAGTWPCWCRSSASDSRGSSRPRPPPCACRRPTLYCVLSRAQTHHPTFPSLVHPSIRRLTTTWPPASGEEAGPPNTISQSWAAAGRCLVGCAAQSAAQQTVTLEPRRCPTPPKAWTQTLPLHDATLLAVISHPSPKPYSNPTLLQCCEEGAAGAGGLRHNQVWHGAAVGLRP